MKNSLLFFLMFIVIPLEAKGEDLILAVNHDDLAPSDYVGVRQIYKRYGFNASFNFILKPFSNDIVMSSMVNNVRQLLDDGNEIGLHAIFHESFWLINKLYDVKPDGSFSFAPTLQEIKYKNGKGLNAFWFYPDDNKLMSQLGFNNPPDDLKDIKLSEISEESYQRLISHYSFYFNKQKVKGLDLEGNLREWEMIRWLEYWFNELIDSSLGYSSLSENVYNQYLQDYCIPKNGSPKDYYPDSNHLLSGKIVRFDDTENENYNNPEYQKVGYFKKGLYKGSSSTCNYEVFDRCIDIAQAFVKYYIGDYSFTNFGRHGVQYADLSYWTWSDKYMAYDNREKTILSGEVGQFYHSRSQRFLTEYDILLGKNIYSTNHQYPLHPFFESQMSLYYGQSGIRFPYFNCANYSNYLDLVGRSKRWGGDIIKKDYFNTFVYNVENMIKYFYEGSGYEIVNTNGERLYIHSYFKDIIDCIRSCMGTGKIPVFCLDTIRDDYSVLEAVELLCKYCTLNGIKIIPIERARQISCSQGRDSVDNYFPNPSFQNTLLPLLDGTSSAMDAYLPDGWKIISGDKYTFNTIYDDKDSVFTASCEDGRLILETRAYGLKSGDYNLSLDAKGDAIIDIYLKHNKDYIDVSLGEWSSPYVSWKTTKDFSNYHTILTIPEPYVNDIATQSSIENQYSRGYEDNVCNIEIRLNVEKGNKVSIKKCQLESSKSNSIYGKKIDSLSHISSFVDKNYVYLLNIPIGSSLFFYNINCNTIYKSLKNKSSNIKIDRLSLPKGVIMVVCGNEVLKFLN